ncbi:FmdB family zinc ribbon protein [Arthrobacter sp. TB 23]|uniref:FmdB family zinc ribbon protein n=1 Tax=Arthrobacter sp. TB 23 TaxID=494419 RepID=UPI0012EAA89C
MLNHNVRDIKDWRFAVPLYEYRCGECGPFEQRRSTGELGQPMPCPRCSTIAKRVYTPPAVGFRSGTSSRGNIDDRVRLDRARTGEPSFTEAPGGRRFPSDAGHRH